MIWKVKPTVEELEKAYPNKNHIGEYIGIVITEIGDDYLAGKMPVDHRTTQPMGLLHGGASCVLAESLGSMAGAMCIDLNKQYVVGLEINANHVRGVKSGWVYGKATPIHLGRATQVWDIKIVNEEQKLVCVSRLTLSVQNF